MVASIMWDFPSSRCVWKHERDSLFLTILPQFFNRLGVTLHYTIIFCRQPSHPNCILTWPANHLSTGSLDIVCDSFAIRYLSSTSLQFTMCMENDDSRHYIYITLHYIGHGGHILSTGSLDKEYEEKWGAKSGGRGGIYQTMGEKKNSSPQEIFGPRNIFFKV